MDIKNAIIGAGLLYLLLPKAAAAAANQVEWEFDKVRIPGDIHLAKGGFDMRLNITNKLPFDISFQDYKGDISQNGNLLATIDSADDVSLPSGKPVTVSAFAKVKGLDLITNILGGKLLSPVEIDSYAYFEVAGEVLTIPVFNSISLFYVA